MLDPLESDSHQKKLKQLLIIGDSVRLTQVFRSIVSNAVKFSDPGSQVWINAVWCPKNLLKEGEGDTFEHHRLLSSSLITTTCRGCDDCQYRPSETIEIRCERVAESHRERLRSG